MREGVKKPGFFDQSLLKTKKSHKNPVSEI